MLSSELSSKSVASDQSTGALCDCGSSLQPFIRPLGPSLVQSCDIQPGARVLDVAAGDGNSSVPAAQLGALVTASDLMPEALELGRGRPEAEGVELEWVQADAQQLPFADDSFDVVMSSIGVMFAPNHNRVATELCRVARPGGTVGLLNWSYEGFAGALFDLQAPYAPAGPSGAQVPQLWGNETHVERLFGPLVDFHTVERHVLEITAFGRASDMADFLLANCAPTIANGANARLQGRGDEFNEKVRGFCEEWNCGSADAARFEWEYLTMVGSAAGASSASVGATASDRYLVTA